MRETTDRLAQARQRTEEPPMRQTLLYTAGTVALIYVMLLGAATNARMQRVHERMLREHDRMMLRSEQTLRDVLTR